MVAAYLCSDSMVFPTGFIEVTPFASRVTPISPVVTRPHEPPSRATILYYNMPYYTLEYTLLYYVVRYYTVIYTLLYKNIHSADHTITYTILYCNMPQGSCQELQQQLQFGCFYKLGGPLKGFRAPLKGFCG